MMKMWHSFKSNSGSDYSLNF